MMPATPLTLVNPRQLVPMKYRLIKFKQYCSNCKTTSEHSEFYAVIPARGGGTTLSRVQSPSDIRYNVPIEQMSRNTDVTPVCHECLTPDLQPFGHLPKPTAEEVAERNKVLGVNRPSWMGTGRHPDEDFIKRKQAEAAEKTQKKTKTFTVDDL